MNLKSNLPKCSLTVRRCNGLTLLDVLLAIVIFAGGMLALASLQGNLTRSSADANARTIGTNIAEELIEQFRTYERLESATGLRAYQDVADQTVTDTRGGVDYTIDVDVTDYYFLPDRESVTDDPDHEDLEGRDTSVSDFKHLELTVNWTGGEFQIAEGTATTGRLGSGTFLVEGIVPSIPQLGAAKVAEEDDGLPGAPPVRYSPGDRPDIIPITVGDQRFKESTTPEPIVRRKDELVETWFDVITWSGTSDDAVFLRREEFVAISCECTLRASAGADEDGLLPTIWTGTEYEEGAKVGKMYGESATNQQSQYCDVCCRDHHDTASSSDDAYRSWDTSGVHKHYSRDKNGNFTEATVGQDYLEACRLVRKDGFFRVAQDFDMQTQIAMPHEFLEDSGNAEDYSDYVIEAVEDHFASPNSPFTAHTLEFDGRSAEFPAALPTVDPVSESRRLMSRAIYTDTVNDKLSSTLGDCFPDREPECTLPEGVSELEVLPFFDVQVTKLGRWDENPRDNPIHVTDDDFSNQGYDRGLAELAGSKQGSSTAIITMESSNVGLIDTLPITADPAAVDIVSELFMVAGGSSEPPPPDGSDVVSGTITAEGGTSDAGAASVVGGDYVTCTRPTPGTFACTISPLAVGELTLTVTNYYKKNTNLIVCSNNAVLAYQAHAQGDSSLANWTRFVIVDSSATDASITITKGTSCP